MRPEAYCGNKDELSIFRRFSARYERLRRQIGGNKKMKKSWFLRTHFFRHSGLPSASRGLGGGLEAPHNHGRRHLHACSCSPRCLQRAAPRSVLQTRAQFLLCSKSSCGTLAPHSFCAALAPLPICSACCWRRRRGSKRPFSSLPFWRGRRLHCVDALWLRS